MKNSSFWISVFVSLLLAGCGQEPENQGASWDSYKGGKDANSYSSLSQINRDNVHQLEVAWTFSATDATGEEKGRIEHNPIIVGRHMYLLSPRLKLFAIDAATAEEIWMFDPFEGTQGAGLSRGIAYWEEGSEARILYSVGKDLYSINAHTGQPDSAFGEGGKVNLNYGLGRDPASLSVSASSPGIVHKNLLIMGSTTGEGYDAAPGHVRAYDVHTGEIAWTFHTIPQPGEFGNDTWPKEAYKTTGGANVWGGMSLDQMREIVYLPTGSAAYDFYGGNREGENLFANCIIALDANTGERLWHFQTVHHDLWDYDLPCPPNLITIEKEGQKINALAQVSKNGFVYLLDRETGEPVFPIEERPVPASDLIGEVSWPTQPVPVKPPPFSRQAFTDADLNYLKEEDRPIVEARLEAAGNETVFNPPSTEGSLMIPGANGGANWGGAAADPEQGILFISSHNWPTLPKMQAISNDVAEMGDTGLPRRLYRKNCASCHGVNREGQHPTIPGLLNLEERMNESGVMALLKNGKGLMPSFAHLSEKNRKRIVNYIFDKIEKSSPQEVVIEPESLDPQSIRYISANGYAFLNSDEGYPAISPPWGTLTAYDLNAGEIAWQVPLGEYEELREKGIPPTGTLNWGGPAVTAGGLVFIAATQDQMFRAFDRATGEVLWETKLPTGGFASPSVYEVDGKQYIVIACGGTRDTPAGNQYVAFSLP